MRVLLSNLKMKHIEQKSRFLALRQGVAFTTRLAGVTSLLIVATAMALTEPYEKSEYITAVEFDWSTFKQFAPGSDIWPVTWADDDNMYTAWGDGGVWGMEPEGLGRPVGYLNFYFAPKWFSKDGRDFTMITTVEDSWATVRGRFTVEEE
jgi:hypothetical protein